MAALIMLTLRQTTLLGYLPLDLTDMLVNDYYVLIAYNAPSDLVPPAPQNLPPGAFPVRIYYQYIYSVDRTKLNAYRSLARLRGLVLKRVFRYSHFTRDSPWGTMIWDKMLCMRCAGFTPSTHSTFDGVSRFDRQRILKQKGYRLCPCWYPTPAIDRSSTVEWGFWQGLEEQEAKFFASQ